VHFESGMAHVDRSTARRPEFADTQPDLRSSTQLARTNPTAPTKPIWTRLEREAKPFLFGAAVGASFGFTLAVLTVKKPPRSFALFPEPESELLKTVGRAALLATLRVALRRAFLKAVATPTAQL